MQLFSNERERRLIDAILDQLIPPNPARNIPAAGELGIASFIAEEIADDASLCESILVLLDQTRSLAGDVTHDVVRQLEIDHPKGFGDLLRLTYMGYYSRSDIRSKVGVAEWPVHPKGYDVPIEPPDLIAELTAPVRARGSIYRDA